MDGIQGLLVANFSNSPAMVLEGLPMGQAAKIKEINLRPPLSVEKGRGVTASQCRLVAAHCDEEMAIDAATRKNGAPAQVKLVPAGLAAVLSSEYQHLQKMVDGLPADLSQNEREQAISLAQEFSTSFSKDEFDLGHTKILKHTIDTGSNRPIRQALRRHPQEHLTFIDAQVDKLLKLGIIEPSASPWSSNIVLVRKHNGQLRMCLDFRAVNSVTYKDAFLLPKI